MKFEQPDSWSSGGEESDLEYDSDDVLEYPSDSELASVSGLDSLSPSSSTTFLPPSSQNQDETLLQQEQDEDEEEVTVPHVLPQSVSLSSPQEITTTIQDPILLDQDHHTSNIAVVQDKVESEEANKADVRQEDAFTAVHTLDVQQSSILDADVQQDLSLQVQGQQQGHHQNEPIESEISTTSAPGSEDRLQHPDQAIGSTVEKAEKTTLPCPTWPLQQQPQQLKHRGQQPPRTAQLYNADRGSSSSNNNSNDDGTITPATAITAPLALNDMSRLIREWDEIVVRYRLKKTALWLVALVLLASSLNFYLNNPHQQDLTSSQPAHAVIRELKYVQNGRVGVAHVDLLTVRGAAFKPKRPYPLHVKILGDRRIGPLRSNNHKMDDLPDIEPIVQDLMNGTSKVYITSLRRRRRRLQETQRSIHWSCVEQPKYFLHMWFENGTQIPDTPLELIWPKPRKSTAVPPTNNGQKGETSTQEKEAHQWEDEEGGEDPLRQWQERLLGPLSKVLPNDTHSWLEASFPQLRPVVCNAHLVARAVVAVSIESAKSLLGVLSRYFDYIFDTKDFLPIQGERLWRQGEKVSQKAVFAFEAIAQNFKEKYERRQQRQYQQQQEKERPAFEPQEPTDLIVTIEEQIRSVVEFIKVDLRARFSPERVDPVLEKAEKVLSDIADYPILDKADQVLTEMEDRIQGLWKSKRMQKLSKKIQTEKYLDKMDRFMTKAERKVEKVVRSKFVQKMQDKIHRQFGYIQKEAMSEHGGDSWKQRWESWTRGGADGGCGERRGCFKKKAPKRHGCGRHR
ncbi:hypothetical protein BGZ83_011733 [Gryganskiella cystojenkinii]|nr:hypothetical protein BGZ83_011733 [Gryganskiella cystojenkinii]